jgi:uncharacterized protein (TIGR02996 family)
MSDEDAFLAGIRGQPQDDLRRLVYADWLEEQDTDECRAKAEYLRLEIHIHTLPDDHPQRDGLILHLRGLAERLPLGWKAAVAKVPIENCNVRWRFQCPKKWDQLEAGMNPHVRFCTACRREVHYYPTVQHARIAAERSGHCVVIDLGVMRRSGDMDMLRGPPELDMDVIRTMGVMLPPDDFNPGAPGDDTAPSSRPGFFRRVWRRMTGGK